MKILWITNIVFPEISASLSCKQDFKSSGGWMLGAAGLLASRNDVHLCVATVSPLVSQLRRIEGESVVYYVIPIGKGNNKVNDEYNDYWIKINKEFSPDVVHIHGTESSHGHAFMKACGSRNVVISIQGLISAYEYYYHYGISKSEIYKTITIRDLIKGTIFSGKKKFKYSSMYELDMIKSAAHIIGRTSWDKARIWAINPNAKYHFCNETLRPEFYDGTRWSYEQCIRHTIFISQASYPLKGFHQILKALPLILRHYPNTMVKIAGHNPTAMDTLFQRLKLSGYGKYLKSLIRKYNLEKHIFFLGPLNAEQMKKEYLSANVFISPSSIENSPNSLGEAQILGVPCISSYVGGAMDMMNENTENLYRFEEIEMLAYKVCRIFENQERQVDMRTTAHNRHNAEENDHRLYNIYKEIINNL